MTLITFLKAWLEARRGDDTGAALVEYALLVSLIAVASIAVLLILGPAIAALFQEVINAL